MVRIDPKYPKRQNTWVLVGATRHQLPMSSPRELHQTVTQNFGFPLGKTTFFHTKTPFLIPIVPKVCLYVYVLKKAIKTISNLKSKHHSNTNHQFTHFSQKLSKQLNSHHNSMIMNTHGINQQQQQHHLTMNSSTITTTTSFYTNLSKNQQSFI